MITASISRQVRKLLRFIFVSLLGLALVVSSSTKTPAHQAFGTQIDVNSADGMLSTERGALSPGTIAATSPLQSGITAYEAGQYPQAIALWKQALTQFQATNDVVHQALVQSNLSLAYQRLGEWNQAEQAIANSLALLQTQPSGVSSADYNNGLAKAWNTQGRQQWISGKPEAALESWRKASRYYEQTSQITGLVGSLINQARALQSMGLSIQAEKTLTQVKQTLEQPQLPTSVRAIGLRNLGVALRQIGSLTGSEQVLQDSLKVTGQSQTEQGAIWLELGNTNRAQGDRAAAIGKLLEAQTYRKQAIAHYQKAAQFVATSDLTVNAQLNQLSLLGDLQAWLVDLDSDLRVNTKRNNPARGIREWTMATIQQIQTTSLVADTQTSLDRLPPGRNSLHARLNLTQSLMKNIEPSTFKIPQGGSKLQNSKGDAQTAGNGRQGMDVMAIAQQITQTVQQARELRDRQTESYATGQLGALYEQVGQYQDAQSLTEQALLLTEGINAPDIRYRWEWQLGRLSRVQGDVPGAIAHYKAAINTLESVRSDLLYVNSDVQFTFRDSVEPVYRGLVDLLLRPQDNQPPSQDSIKQAIREVDNLQLSELENFMGCDLGPSVAITDVNADPSAATLYPLLLDDRIAIVLKLPGQKDLQVHQTPISRQTVEDTLNRLYQNLEVPGLAATEDAEKVYQWLIQPIADQLAKADQIKTLVFVSDGLLRKVPMSILYDGDRYLIEQYAVALAPRLELFSPKARTAASTLFTGGAQQAAFEAANRFSPIELFNQELDGIAQHTNIRQSLRDANFTLSNLETQLAQGGFSTVHIKTHGQFSSDPAETFIVAYDKLVNTKELGQLIQTGVEGTDNAIDLLVLSACYGAKGDNRAVLGLTGIALQSGARSALATLWEAQDASNTELMIRFYQELLQPNTTKAEALRQAQLALRQEAGYQNPHYWATYLLVGNWL